MKNRVTKACAVCFILMACVTAVVVNHSEELDREVANLTSANESLAAEAQRLKDKNEICRILQDTPILPPPTKYRETGL